ncbi:MAG TPA: adenylyl-sulfate kinase, partial [Noviherbaspirillum sp.]|uniref:adenylyl-sulfate kinase n=1 Tax=Noviherbaspirillum sp. TaxID=1926288 RepID=UPI002D255A79
GDNLRHRLNRDLSFSAADRKENLRRAAEVARLMNEAGLIVLASFISPIRDDREMVRRLVGDERFVEVHVSTPLEVCAARDPKGLYAMARGGRILEFTGVTAPYEAPSRPALELDTARISTEEAAQRLYGFLVQRFF